MFEMTEALIHHARFCVLNMTGGDPVEAARELTAVKTSAYNAGCLAFRNGAPIPNGFHSELVEECQQGYLEEEYDQLKEREWRENYEAEKAAEQLAYPDSPVERALYCPGGHNVVFTKAGRDECGACGQIMTENAEDQYMNSLIRAGQCM